MKTKTFARYAGVVTLLSSTLACGGSDDGSLHVLLAAEDTISNGLQAGSAEEDTRDYGVTYTKYIAVVGNVTVSRTSPAGSVRADEVLIADMQQVGEQGQEITSFGSMRPGQWDQFGYETPVANASAMVLGVSAADAQVMIDEQLTYWIEGSVNRPDKPVRFVLKVAVPTTYSGCETNGRPGVSISDSGASTATITLHGDHLWFDSLVRGNEDTVTRRTQWLVDADVDGDGMVTSTDLANVSASKVFPNANYNLSGAPIPIVTALDFVRAQLATQGHLNGEGECETLLP